MKKFMVGFCLFMGIAHEAESYAQEGRPSAPDESRWLRNIRQLTSAEIGLARSGEAYFAPDGRSVCFQAYPTGQEDYQIYVMNIDGTGLKLVSKGVGATTCSYFHPGGEKLLFAANHDDLRPPTDFEAMRPRPTAAPADAGGAGSAAQGATTRPAHATPHAGGGAHPGGGHAEGGGARHGGGMGYAWKYFPGMELYEYTLKTGELRRLTQSDGYDAEGSYSPDGRHIVFSSFRDGDQQVYICDADGGNPRRVTKVANGGGGPFFSPDGQRIVYRADRTGSGNLQVFVNNLEGTEEKALTGNDDFNWCPYWHPSGKWIIFTHVDFRQRPNFDLYLISVDGTQRHRVTFDTGFDGLPVFSPDGKKLMWTAKRNGVEAPQVFIADFVGLTPDGKLVE